MPIRLAELAVRFGCVLRGDPDIEIDRVASLQSAGAGALSFLANPRYRRYLATTAASAVVLAPEEAGDTQVAALLTPNPYATYARIAQLLYPVPDFAPGLHAAAVVHAEARIDPTAWVGAGTIIEAGVRIGRAAFVGPGCLLMAGASIGAGTRLVGRVTLCPQVLIGERCILHPGVVIGADGFGFAADAGSWVKVPQVGSVRIGNDVDIGANTTVDRGAIDDTVIEDGVKLDNQIQIGHNVRVGAHTVIAGCTGVSGSVTIGAHCMIGGMVGIAGHLSICDDVIVTGKSMVSRSVRKPGVYSGTLPLDEAKVFRRNVARFRNLDDFVRRSRLAGGSGPPEGDRQPPQERDHE